MTRDSSINRVDDFERLTQVLGQLNISVRRTDGSFRCVSEVLDDLWRYTTDGYTLGHNTLTTPVTMSIQPPCKKQKDWFDNPDLEAIDNYLAGFKIV